MAHAPDETRPASISAVFEREHREIDAGIEAFVEGAVPDDRSRDRLATSVVTLRRHIYAEEELMFPALREAGMVGPILVMLREHAAMWPLLDTLDHLLADRTADVTAMTGVCAELFAQLQRHNPKEEQILYPQTESALSAAARAALDGFLVSGELPAGWICQGLRR